MAAWNAKFPSFTRDKLRNAKIGTASQLLELCGTYASPFQKAIQFRERHLAPASGSKKLTPHYPSRLYYYVTRCCV